MIETTDGFEHVTMYQTEEEVGFWTQYSDIDFCSDEFGCYICSINWDKEFYSDSHAYISNDSGLSWTEVPYGIHNKMFVYSVAATDSTFFIASQKGVLYKFDSSPYLGVEDNHLEVSIFPNPVNGRVVIEGIEAAEVQIFNAIGQCVASAKCKSEPSTIDIANLPAGVYFVNVTDGEGRKCVKKVVKE